MDAGTAPGNAGTDGGTPQAPSSAPVVGQQNNQSSTNQVSQTPEQIAAEQDNKEWEDAQDEIFPGLRSKNSKKDTNNEQAKPEEVNQETSADTENSKNKALDEEQGVSDDSETQGEDNKTNDSAAAARAARNANREYSKQIAEVKSDVMSKMYADAPSTLVDADGDPINTIDDVMQLIDPRTNEAFTEEAAAAWLLSAQQSFNKTQAANEREAERIAELNVDIKDQADSINDKYGDFLSKNTKLRDELWVQFDKTLVKDENSGIIVDMPISLEEFYEFQLTPRMEAQQQQVQLQASQQQDVAQQQMQKQQNRKDRSDIYGGSGTDVVDQEDKEWGEAATAYFGPRK